MIDGMGEEMNRWRGMSGSEGSWGMRKVRVRAGMGPSQGFKREYERGRNVLIYHQRTNPNLLSVNLATINQRILLVEERNERRTIMSTVRFRGEDEPTNVHATHARHTTTPRHTTRPTQTKSDPSQTADFVCMYV